MIDKIKNFLGGGLGITLGLGFAFSWLLGIFTAVTTNDAPG